MEELLFSGENILERVDEYTLYCSYLDFEPLIGGIYQSPVRSSVNADADVDPSFGIFVNTRAQKNIGNGSYPNEFLWKDQALGIGGDIFELVRRICRLNTRREAMVQVMIDAGILHGERSRPIIDTADKKFMGFSDIRVRSRQHMDSTELKFWAKGNIKSAILDRYLCRSLSMYWLYEDQYYARFTPHMSFSYQIWDRYQLYFPKSGSKSFKFRTDWTNVCVPGFLQLEYNQSTLIITKSMKDVMCLRSFGYEAISPRGENIMLPPECISMMKRKYKKIMVLFDNDGKHSGHKYEFEKIFVPEIKPGDKDVYDFCNNHGPADTAEMLRQIIG